MDILLPFYFASAEQMQSTFRTRGNLKHTKKNQLF